MSANRIFLVCSRHPQLEEALCLAERHSAESQYRVSRCRCLGKCGCDSVERARQQDWFKKHAACGVDQFKLAFNRPQGWDVSPPAPAVASAVRLAIANGDGSNNGSNHE